MHYDDAQMDFYPVLTPRDMRETEQKAFALGVPSMLLMEHAALAVVDELEKALGGCCREKKVLFLCGTGNNGGDGLAAARLFAMRGGYPEIWLSGLPKTPDARMNYQWCMQLGLDILNLGELAEEEMPFAGEAPRDHFDGYVDALLGTGLKGRPDALTEKMINAPRHDFENHPVIAVDIPSGVNGRTGEIFDGAYMHADVTVTFHAPKPGLYLTRDREAVGKIVISDIGLWNMAPWRSDALLLDEMELNCEMVSPRAIRLLPRRRLNAHKGDCGRILIYAGSMGMAGAAAMCARAAIAAGAGLTTIACPREIIPVLQVLAPNAMCVDIEEAVQNPPAYDVLAVGCGLSQKEGVWENILKLYDPQRPSVWDADALNLLAKQPMKLGKNAVITPHPGEAARLLGWSMEKILADRFQANRALCEKFDCTAVLKSDVTVIGEMQENIPCYYLNAVGSPALAKGGSGDALAGMLAALLHSQGPGAETAALASLWHGMAGVVGESKFGQRELTTMQLIDCLHEAEKWGRGEMPPPDTKK